MSTAIDDIEPKAVMTPEQLEAWSKLPPEEQLKRLRAAVERGIASGVSDLDMDQIWARLRARHPNADL